MSNQLVKRNPVEGYKNVFPKTFIDAIKDRESGLSLLEIIQGFNMYFLSYNGSVVLTRCKVPKALRKEGLWITYVLYDHTVVTEWYNSDNIDDESWGSDSNWRKASNALVGDISISTEGYWIINGVTTNTKAQGETGITPLLRVGDNNKIQVTYDEGKNWEDISDYIVPKFRWNQGTGTTAGTIQISMDLGNTWKDLSNPITNNLRISKYIGINESLPTSGVAEGTIYMKGPYYDENDSLNENPIYRMWVYAWKGNTLAWQDNGEFTSISAGVVQERGTSTTEVMSQDAVTRELTELESEVLLNGHGLRISEEMLKQGAPTYSEAITVSTKGNIKVLPSRKYKFDNVDDILIAVYETKDSGAVELMKWMEAINEYTTSSNAVAVQLGFRKSDLSNITPASIAAIGITMRDWDAITILREEINSSDERIIELEKRSDFLGNGYPLMLEMLKQGIPTYPDANSVHTIPIDVKASRKYIFNNVHNLLVSVYEVDSAGNSTIKVWKQEINDYDTTDSAKAVIMAFTSKDASALTPDTVYEMGISIQDASANSILKEGIDEIHDNITTSPYVIEEYPACWVRAEDGAIISATDIHYAVKYSVDGLKMVRVKGMWYGNNVAAIAFFNKDGKYLPQYTINAVNTEVITTLESAVPSEASYALSCSSRSFLPIVETNEIGRTLNAMSKSLSGSMGFCKKSIMSGVTKSEVYPISHCVDYHHLFIDKIYEGSQVTIPCQSLFDVAVAASLGFEMIEANVLLTSDGVAVTGHSIGGSVLQTLTDLNGNEVDVDVSSITFADLRANYRYKSIFSQYRTPITSLEEFLIECKRYNLTPFVQCVSDSVIALVESIVGKRYVAYNATRKQTSVTIYEYKRGTIDELVARCKDVGAPYILGVHAENLNAFTDAEIQELLTKVHAEGCWLGWAGCYHSVEESLRFRRLGLDFSGSGWDVPDFSEGNEAKAIGNSIVGFSAFKGGYVESDGKALLNKEKDIQLYLEQKSIISKASLHIHFKGDIGITFGKINDHIISDGLKGITLTSVIENSSPELYIYAYNDAEIYSINYVVNSIL